MKLIKKGTGQKGWAKEYSCTGIGNGGGGCTALLLVEQPDLYYTYHSCYDGSTDKFVTFTCSQCGIETDIEDMPSNLNIRDKKDRLI